MPTSVGVPEITPSAKVRPAGSVPDVMTADAPSLYSNGSSARAVRVTSCGRCGSAGTTIVASMTPKTLPAGVAIVRMTLNDPSPCSAATETLLVDASNVTPSGSVPSTLKVTV